MASTLFTSDDSRFLRDFQCLCGGWVGGVGGGSGAEREGKEGKWAREEEDECRTRLQICHSARFGAKQVAYECILV